jgi:aminoglycoside N3'-acetyltransferase
MGRGMDEAELRRAFAAAGLTGQRAVVHSSLRSIGHVEGGADAVARALRATLDTLLVPTCCWGEGSAECAAPAGERWLHNGRRAGEGPSHVPVRFDPQLTPPVPAMGAIPRAVLRLTGVTRGAHPLTSFAAVGADAGRYTAGQSGSEPQFPLEQLAADDGVVALLGVNLTRCTALHIAEQRAGRQPFVRWVLGSGGEVEAVRVGGCSEGFERLWPALSPVFRAVRVGHAQLRVARLSALIERAVDCLRDDPSIMRCHVVDCVRCLDALRGGPSPRSD